MPRFTEVQRLRKRIKEIQEKCKHRKLIILNTDNNQEIIIVGCKRCDLLFTLSWMKRCPKCLGKVNQVGDSRIDLPNRSEITKYKCQACN